ncbi:hypothetical protein Hanom_Chr00s082955g01795001 [Helianthus anomalus]
MSLCLSVFVYIMVSFVNLLLVRSGGWIYVCVLSCYLSCIFVLEITFIFHM